MENEAMARELAVWLNAPERWGDLLDVIDRIDALMNALMVSGSARDLLYAEPVGFVVDARGVLAFGPLDRLLGEGSDDELLMLSPEEE